VESPSLARAINYLAKHQDDLVAKYPHTWVAIRLAGGVAAHAESLDALSSEVQRQGLRGRVLVTRIEPHATIGL